MATLTAVNPVVSKGAHMETVSKLILNGQSWTAGALLTITSAGLLRVVATGPTAAIGGIKYYALTGQSNPGNSTTYAKVGVITPSTVFEGNELDGTADLAFVGDSYNIDLTGGVYTVDCGSVDKPAVIVTEVASEYERIKNSAADVKGRLRFRILSTMLDAVGVDAA